jgi:3-oxoacyl-[acyl-carrier protein] reductase
MDSRLDGKRALVCGASRGIGRAVAQALAQAGAEIVALARDADALQRLIETLPADGEREHQAMALDVGDGDALTAAMTTLAGSGPVHVIVNNSGGPPAGPATAAAPEEYLAAFTQHVLASQRILQALLPGMKSAGYGRIVNIISTSVKEPIAGLGVSNTVRGAMAGWAKTIARELAPHAITVNNVLPGFTDTERLDYIFQVHAQKRGLTPEQVREEALASVPAGRFADPAETAAAVAFLASPAAAYVNGINLPVDGGRTGSL